MRGQRPSLLERTVAGQDKLPAAGRRAVRRGTAHGHARRQLIRDVHATRVIAQVRITSQRIVVAVANR